MIYFIVLADNNTIEYVSTKKEKIADWENDPRYTIKTFTPVSADEISDRDNVLYAIKDNNVTNMEFGNHNTFSFNKIGVKNQIKFITGRINHGYDIELDHLKEVA